MSCNYCAWQENADNLCPDCKRDKTGHGGFHLCAEDGGASAENEHLRHQLEEARSELFDLAFFKAELGDRTADLEEALELLQSWVRYGNTVPFPGQRLIDTVDFISKISLKKEENEEDT